MLDFANILALSGWEVQVRVKYGARSEYSNPDFPGANYDSNIFRGQKIS
jgi:hypothetical protein